MFMKAWKDYECEHGPKNSCGDKQGTWMWKWRINDNMEKFVPYKCHQLPLELKLWSGKRKHLFCKVVKHKMCPFIEFRRWGIIYLWVLYVKLELMLVHLSKHGYYNCIYNYDCNHCATFDCMIMYHLLYTSILPLIISKTIVANTINNYIFHECSHYFQHDQCGWWLLVSWHMPKKWTNCCVVAK
jgi:hypothetical protein